MSMSEYNPYAEISKAVTKACEDFQQGMAKINAAKSAQENDSQALEHLCRLCKSNAKTLTNHMCDNCIAEGELMRRINKSSSHIIAGDYDKNQALEIAFKRAMSKPL